MTGIDYLQTLHTKQILNLKNECQGRLMRYDGIGCTWNGITVVVTLEDIKQVLSERPHILTSRETKQIRKVAAKSKVRAQSTSRESLNSEDGVAAEIHPPHPTGTPPWRGFYES